MVVRGRVGLLMQHSASVAQAASDASAVGAAKATYFGGALSAIGGIALSSEAIAIAGLALALAGWATQLWFGIRRDKREDEEHRLKITELRQRMAGARP